MSADPAPPGAIDRTLAVLDALAEHGEPMRITELANRIGLSKSVVHYHLSALLRNRYVDVNSQRRYVLGAAALRLGRNSYASGELRLRAGPYMRSLHELTRETVTLTTLLGNERIYVDQLVSPHEIKMSVELGRPFPLHAGSSGKAILAFLPERVRDSILGGSLERLTSRTPTEPHALEVELAAIRRQGSAISRGERQPGAASVAAPVLDGSSVVGSMSVCGPEYRFDEAAVERYRDLVHAAAAKLSAELTRR
jgi:DNA-binding IclR family transcriptional regulator